MKIIYRKVSVEERLPKEKDNYFTNVGLCAFFPEDKTFVHTVTWWLEEISLPTDEFISIDALEQEYLGDNVYEAWQGGAKWMRDFISQKNR